MGGLPNSSHGSGASNSCGANRRFGEPKCGKSFLDLAVATGTPCRFPAAESCCSPPKTPFTSCASAASPKPQEPVLTISTWPCALANDRQRLTVRRATHAGSRPSREDAAGEVAPLLACLRDLQRNFETAVVLHARKSAHGGQALRGSSELHAWGDSNLRKTAHSAEHRAALTRSLCARHRSCRCRSSRPPAPTESPRQREPSRRHPALPAADPGGRHTPAPFSGNWWASRSHP